MPFEIESWDKDARKAVVWVKVPVIDGNSTTDYITMFWGNRNAQKGSSPHKVFSADAGFKGVWHLSGNFLTDASSIRNNGIDEGTTATDGISDGARHLNLDTRIRIPHNDNYNLNEMSLSMWIRYNSAPVDWSCGQPRLWDKLYSEALTFSISKDGQHTSASPGLRVRGNCIEAYSNACAITTSPMVWQHVAFTYKEGSIRFYVNGQPAGLVTNVAAPSFNMQPVFIGNNNDLTRDFKGDIDEIEMSGVERSSAWFKLAYENEKIPQTLYRFDDLDRLGDPDSDGVVTVIEKRMGTDPLNRYDYPLIAIPDKPLMIDSAQEQTVYYDFSRFFPDYSSACSVKVVYAPGTIPSDSVVPIIQIVDQVAEDVNIFNMKRIGRYVDYNGPLCAGAEISMPIPFPANHDIIIPGFLKAAHYGGSGWQTPKIDSVTDQAMYATLLHFSAGAGLSLVEKNSDAYIDDYAVFSRGSVEYSQLTFSIGIHSLPSPNPSQYYMEYTISTFNGISWSDPVTVREDFYYDNNNNFTAIFTAQKNTKMRLDQVILHTESRTYTKDFNKEIDPGKNLCLSMSEEEWNIPSDLSGVFYIYEDRVNEMGLKYVNIRTPSGIDGRIETDYNISAHAEKFYFYAKDHLGSTRVVYDYNNDSYNSDIVRSWLYTAYGEQIDVGPVTPVDVKEKFTGKEFDQEGPAFGTVKVDFTLNFPNIASSRIGVYYSDGGCDVANFVYDETSNNYRLTQTFNLSTEKTVTYIHFVLNPEQGPPNEVDCQINLNETVSPGQQLNLSKTVNSPTEFTNGLTIDFFTHSRDEYDFKGIALDYFGARYYDPEIGTWTSTDPSDQYWNAYSYCGADPINSIDIDGCYSAPTVQVHPVQPIIQQTYNQVNVVQSLLADYNSLAYDQIYNLTSLSGIINYDYEYRYNAPSIDYNKLVNIINTVDPAMVANGADATGSYWQYEIQSEDPSTVAKAIGLLELIGLSTPIAQELIIAGFLTYMTYLAFHEDIGKLWHSGHGHYDKKTGKREDPHVHDLTKHTDPKTGKVRIKKGPGRAPKAGETK